MSNNSKRINVNPNLYFQKQNAQFNHEADMIVDDIFQTHLITSEDYILIGDYLIDHVKDFTPFSEIDKALLTYNGEKELKDKHSIATASAYENLLANLMLNGKFDTYVIAGGMGTGKSSTTEYILNFLSKTNASKSPLIIKFNFNGPYDGTEDEIVRSFKRELFDKVEIAIELYFLTNRGTLDEFCSLFNDPERRLNFSDFNSFRPCREVEWVENVISYQEKVSKFIDYIAKHEEKLTLAMKVVNFIVWGKNPRAKSHRDKNRTPENLVICVFDNIDIQPPNVQRRILNLVFKYNVVAEAKCFIPLRRATFKRTMKAIEEENIDQAVYSFGYIHHHGIDPVKIVLSRVDNFLLNANSNSLLGSIDLKFQRELINRFLVFKELLQKDNVFSKFFVNVAGRSSRLALGLSQKFFINNVVEYNKHKINVDIATKFFMVAKSSRYIFDNNSDRDIANLLCGNIYSNLSFIPYLILQHVKNANEIEEFEVRTVFANVSKSLVGGLSTNEFIDGLNYLLPKRRPLLWSDETAYYKANEDITKCTNTLQFTELGRGYLDIISHSTQYLQECLISLRWSHDYVPQKYDSFHFLERFGLMRKCISEIMEKEVNEISYPQGVKALSEVLFITIGNSLQRILFSKTYPSDIKDDDLIAEIFDWKNLYMTMGNNYGFHTLIHEKIAQFLERFNGNLSVLDHY